MNFTLKCRWPSQLYSEIEIAVIRGCPSQPFSEVAVIRGCPSQLYYEAAAVRGCPRKLFCNDKGLL